MAVLERDTGAGPRPIDLTRISPAPLVSVLVSNYNYARYIGETLQSVLNQTYSNFELIVCDDGSTDDSARIIEAFSRGDPRVRLIRKTNGGQASGFNAAYAASRGAILCLLDSDDLFLPTKIERVVAAHRVNPDAGFGIHRVIRVSERRRRQGVWPTSESLPQGWFGSRLIEDGGILPYMPPTSGLSLHRDVAERIFPLPLEAPLGSCPDQVITRLAPLLTGVMRQSEALAEYRLHRRNNYGPTRVTAASLQRELVTCDALWRNQKRFLDEMNPSLGRRFQPIDSHPYVLYLRYLHSRLARESEARQHHARYMKSLSEQDGVRYAWFWKVSIHLPRFLFDHAVNAMIRQSLLKQIVARCKGLA